MQKHKSLGKLAAAELSRFPPITDWAKFLMKHSYVDSEAEGEKKFAEAILQKQDDRETRKSYLDLDTLVGLRDAGYEHFLDVLTRFVNSGERRESLSFYTFKREESAILLSSYFERDGILTPAESGEIGGSTPRAYAELLQGFIKHVVSALHEEGKAHKTPHAVRAWVKRQGSPYKFKDNEWVFRGDQLYLNYYLKNYDKSWTRRHLERPIKKAKEELGIIPSRRSR